MVVVVVVIIVVVLLLVVVLQAAAAAAAAVVVFISILQIRKSNYVWKLLEQFFTICMSLKHAKIYKLLTKGSY